MSLPLNLANIKYEIRYEKLKWNYRKIVGKNAYASMSAAPSKQEK